MQFTSWSATDLGQIRIHNDDTLLAMDELGLFAVADGVSGAKAGAVASQLFARC